jgi:hypothetical protein
MRRKEPRTAMSLVPVTFAVILVEGTIAAGLYLSGVASPSAAASSTISSSSTTSSSTGFTHTTSSVSSTTTPIIVGGGASSGEIGPPPIITILFGAPTIDHPTTTEVPAYTMLWTSWKLNSTMTIDGVQSDIDCLPSSWGSNLMIAVYVDGKLAGNSTYPIAPNYGGPNATTIDAPENYNIIGGIPGNYTQPAGAVISMAILSNASVDPHFNSGSVTTYEVTLPPGSGFPTQLPTPTTTISDSAVEIWALDETQQ